MACAKGVQLAQGTALFHQPSQKSFERQMREWDLSQEWSLRTLRDLAREDITKHAGPGLVICKPRKGDWSRKENDVLRDVMRTARPNEPVARLAVSAAAAGSQRPAARQRWGRAGTHAPTHTHAPPYNRCPTGQGIRAHQRAHLERHSEPLAETQKD